MSERRFNLDWLLITLLRELIPGTLSARAVYTPLSPPVLSRALNVVESLLAVARFMARTARSFPRASQPSSFVVVVVFFN